MPLYVDTSAWLKRYLEETDSKACERYLLSETLWLSGRHTYVEIRRNLARALMGDELSRMREAFEQDWRRVTVIEIDATTCRLAADIAEQTGLRSLDALHLGAASRLSPRGIHLLTYDIKQAQAARQLGFVVLGA